MIGICDIWWGPWGYVSALVFCSMQHAAYTSEEVEQPALGNDPNTMGTTSE